VAPGYWGRSLGLRFAIAASYVILIPAGLLPMSAAWWVVSGWGLLAYSAAMLGIYLWRGPILLLHRNIGPFADTFFVTLAVVALARPDYPIWMGYVMIISALSVFHSTRYMLAFSLVTIAAYWTGLVALDAMGRGDVSWQIAIVVSIMAAFTAFNSDVIATSNRKLHDLVQKSAHTDPLTGLDNRRRFRQILDSHDTPESCPLAVLMYDVDNFKQLNESRGHVHADTVLVRVAEELSAIFRGADTVARYGGDELVVLAHVNSIADALDLAERSLIEINERTDVTLSVGVAVYPISADTIEGALREADDALGRAKRAGKARAVTAA
jgi:diguanylate cyclase (GGDEF)-like protein